MQEPQSFRRSAAFFVLLVGMLAVQPFSTDFYLPTLPSLTQALHASPAAVTWTLSALVGTFGITQLFVGPLADRYGRKPVATAGYAIYLAGSLAAIFAPGIAWMIACRMLQGLGMSCAFVVARALIRDLYAPQDGARVMAHGLAWMGGVALLGPFISGLLASLFGWQAAFVVLSLYSAGMFALCIAALPETAAHRNPQATRVGPLLANYAHILRNPVFNGFNATSACSYGGLFAFISGSAFVFLQRYGLSRAAYGLAFGATVAGYLVGTVLCRHLLARWGMRRTLLIGGGVSLSCATIMALGVVAGTPSMLAVLLPQIGYMVAHGIVQPVSQAGCVGPFPRMAGAASALNGFSQMMTAVGVGALMSASFDGTARPMALTIFVAGIGVASACAYMAWRPNLQQGA